jgi:hypothetical protein
MPTYKNVVRTWIEYEREGREHKTVLVIETDIELWPDHQGYDSTAFDELVSHAVQKMKLNPESYDIVRIISKKIGA